MSYTDEEILGQMIQDRERGAAALLETYAGLLWSVCARRLENEEDVKECVNDAFCEFCMGFERYQPEKGSLKNYLCLIADRRALNRRRDNLRREKAEEAAEQEREIQEEAKCRELMRQELEDALSRLEPLDGQIIRMKYYGGLTYQEIAEKLGMNYEAVKKRGRRSLKKLWKVLLLGIILLFLAACAVIAYRHFQFAEGIGINWSLDSSLYRLTETSAPCQADGISFEVTDAIYQDGFLYVRIEYRYGTVFKDVSERNRYVNVQQEYERLEINGEPSENIAQGTYYRYSEEEHSTDHYSDNGIPIEIGGVMEFRCRWRPEQEPGPEGLELRVALAGLENGQHKKMEYEELVNDEYIRNSVTLTGPNPEFVLNLTEVDVVEDVSALGTVETFEDTGFLITAGVPAKGQTEFSLYPLNEGLGQGSYHISSILVNNYKGMGSREPGKVTLKSPETGETYEAVSIRGNSIGGMERIAMLFPPLKEGKYVMSIPFLCLDGNLESERIALALPGESGESVSCDERILFPDGTGIHLKGIYCEKYEPEPSKDGALRFAEWRYRLDFTPIGKGDLQFCTAAGSSVFYHDDFPKAGSGGEEGFEGGESGILGGTHLSGGELWITASCDEAPVWVEFGLREGVYILERAFEVKVLVEE